MAFPKNAVGIDLGTYAIKVVQVRVSPKGVSVVQALHLDRETLAEEGVDLANVADLARHLRAHLDEARIPTRGVVLGIGGQDSIIRYTRTPPVPAWRLKVIMDYEMGEFSERTGESLASDFRVLNLMRELDEDQTILIAHAKEEPLGAVLEAFEAEGITVSKAVPGAIALFTVHDALGTKADPDAAEDDLVLLVDLGASNLNLALLLNDRLVFARSVSFGAGNFTEALVQSLDMTAAEAERLKIKRCGLSEDVRGIFQDGVGPLRSVAGQLLNTLQSSLRFASSQTGAKLPPLSRVVLFGGGTRLRGLRRLLRQGLNAPAEYFESPVMSLMDSLSEDARAVLSERPGEFGACLGLGISSMREASGDEGVSSISILPAKYLKRREFKERTIFLYAAAGLLVFLLVGRLAYGLVQNYKAGAVHEGLVAQRTELTGYKQEMEQSRQLANQGRARLNQLLKEAEQTAFQAYVLDLLGRALRPEIQLTSVQWAVESADSKEAEEQDLYVLKVAGRASNEKRRGLEWILELQRTLQEDDRIREVQEVSSEAEGVWYKFGFWLHPNYVRY